MTDRNFDSPTDQTTPEKFAFRLEDPGTGFDPEDYSIEIDTINPVYGNPARVVVNTFASSARFADRKTSMLDYTYGRDPDPLRNDQMVPEAKIIDQALKGVPDLGKFKICKKSAAVKKIAIKIRIKNNLKSDTKGLVIGQI